MIEKKIIRQEVKEKLDKINDVQRKVASSKIIGYLKTLIDKFDVWAIYLAMNDEPDIDEFIKILKNYNKKTVLPQVMWDGVIRSVMYSSYSEFKKWRFGNREIIHPQIYKWKIDVILIPWIAFDKKWVRLGRWGGYYDRFLKNYPESKKIWVCFSCQIYDELPLQAHDVLMDEVLY